MRVDVGRSDEAAARVDLLARFEAEGTLQPHDPAAGDCDIERCVVGVSQAGIANADIDAGHKPFISSNQRPYSSRVRYAAIEAESKKAQR